MNGKAKRVRAADCSVMRITHNGALVVAAMVDNHYVRRQYMGYSTRAAVRLFCEEVNK